MAGLTQALKVARNNLRRLMDEFQARYGDATSSSIPQRRMQQEIERQQAAVKAMQEELVNAPTPEWGPTPGAMRVQEMMDRYGDVKQGMGSPPEIMEQRLPQQLDMFEDAARRQRVEMLHRQMREDPRFKYYTSDAPNYDHVENDQMQLDRYRQFIQDHGPHWD